ncbi:MAG: M23 family metallopeptidase, partial [Firmicutes bacterium]|nr:M23 family metallopeptidase [Bacillota bacterium]
AIATRQKESEELAALIRAATAPTDKVGSGIYAWPLRGYSNVSSDYGWRTLRGKRNLHTGIDMPAPKGTPIYACDSGEVILARWYGSYGYCVIINHGNNMSTLYAHQSKLGCSVGDSVDQGDVIGYVGSTGNSTGNHLHLEVRKNGNHTSPWNYVSKP